jgi:hypothetical protein
MFMDYRGEWPPHWEPEPPREPRRLTKRGEKVVGSLVAVNILLLLLGPIAGATVLDPIIYWLFRR